MAADLRCMVPIGYDLDTRRYRVFVVAGVTTEPLRVAFAVRPEVTVLDAVTRTPVTDGSVTWRDSTCRILGLVGFELDVPRLLDRPKVAALCDAHVDIEALRAALSV
jgi:hypothetical protein